MRWGSTAYRIYGPLQNHSKFVLLFPLKCYNSKFQLNIDGNKPSISYLAHDRVFVECNFCCKLPQQMAPPARLRSDAWRDRNAHATCIFGDSLT